MAGATGPRYNNSRWSITAIAAEDIEAGSIVELDPPTGRVRNRRPLPTVNPGDAYISGPCNNPSCIVCNTINDVLRERPIPDNRPHSRACGIHCPGHGRGCASDCPTCLGRFNFRRDTVNVAYFDGTNPVRPNSTTDLDTDADFHRHPYSD